MNDDNNIEEIDKATEELIKVHKKLVEAELARDKAQHDMRIAEDNVASLKENILTAHRRLMDATKETKKNERR